MKKFFDKKKLKRERIAAGLTFGTLAKRIQELEPLVSKSSVWQWESKGTEPSYRYIMALCAVFQKDPEYFVKQK